DTEAMAPLLALYAIGLPFFSVVSLTVRAFYSVQNTKAPVRIATIDFLINLCLSLVLMRWLGAAGLVIASTCAIIAQTWLLQRELKRILPDVSLAPLAPSLAKIAAATVAMGLFVWGGAHVVAGLALGQKARDVIAIVGLIPASCALYGGVLWMLKIEGREEFAVLLEKIRGRFARG
ncbi:MAG TPA: lipid II flippase MurJ, partial [Lacunisphaera sp.]